MSLSKRNPKFVQFKDPDGLKAMEAIAMKKPTAAALFMFMTRHIDNDNCLIVSVDLLAKKLNSSKSTILRSIKFLNEHNYLAVFRSGTSNVYTLNADIVWKDHGDKRASALLQGKVLLDLDEQDEQVQTKVRRGFKQLELV